MHLYYVAVQLLNPATFKQELDKRFPSRKTNMQTWTGIPKGFKSNHNGFEELKGTITGYKIEEDELKETINQDHVCILEF
ncbi:hypothetical protein ACOSQ2_011971 [Xanthoceras sorbifolium]